MRVILTVSLLLSMLGGATPLARPRDPETTHVPPLQLKDLPVKVRNNALQDYHFGLSVVGLSEEGEFVPLLAIAIDYSGPGESQWMALWNLNSGGTAVLSQLKALLPNLWGTLGKRDDTKVVDFPKPFLTWDSKKGRAWTEFKWLSLETANSLIGFFNPARFALKNYTYYRDDTAERRFFQTYTLVRLYEEAAELDPSVRSLSKKALTDLKYHLIISRSGLGVFAEGQDAPSVVGRFESAMRESVAQASCYAHDEANQLYLGFQEVPYGLPGRPPIARAGLLSIRKLDLPDPLPQWPGNNLFDLSSEPYTHPRVRELMDLDPDDHVPLGIYVFGGDLRVKPVLVVDFFNPGNPRKRRATGAMKVALDNFLSVRGIPWFGRILKRTVEYGIDKKDFSYFRDYSAALSLEATRLFARMGWNFDDDTNHQMIQVMEHRIANPLVESSERERENVKGNFEALLSDDSAPLGLFLRCLLEDRIRRTLDLENKAVFAQEIARYHERIEYQRAQETVRAFNRQSHLPSTSWDAIESAWRILREHSMPEDREELEALRARVGLLYPEHIPEARRVAIHQLLQPGNQLAGSFTVPRSGVSD